MVYNIFVVLFMYVLSLFAGYPICTIINRFYKLERGYELVLMPWFGMISIMLGCYYGSLLGKSVSEIYVVVFFINVMCVVAVHLLKNKGTKLINATLDRKDKGFIVSLQWGGIFAVLAIVTCFFCLAPIVYNNNNMPILLGNNDYILTNSILEYVDQFSIRELGQTYGGLFVESWVRGPQARQICFVIAYFKEIIAGEFITLQYLFVAYMYGLMLIGFGVIFSKLGMQKRYIAICLTLILLNSNYQWLIYQGFLAQMCSVGLFISILIAFVKVVEMPNVINGIILGVLVVGEGMIYPDLMAFIVLPMCITLIYLFLRKKYAYRALGSCGIAMITAGILNPAVYYNTIKMLFFADSAEVGWDVSRSFLLRAIGIGNVHISDQIGMTYLAETVRNVIEIILSIALLLICISTLRKQLKASKDREKGLHNFLEIIAIFGITYIVVYIGILLRYRDSLYKSYKALVAMTFILIIGIGYVLYILWLKKRKLIQTIICIGIGLSLLSGVLFPITDLAAGSRINTGTYPNTTFHRKEHRILNTAIESNKERCFWLDISPEIWDEHYAISQLEYHGYQWKTIAENTFWNINCRAHTDLPQKGDIYIGSAVLRDPLYYGDEIIAENEVYNIRRITLENPFCVETYNLTDVCTINRGYSDGDTVRLLDNGRWLKEDATIRYYSELDTKKDVTLEYYNADNMPHTVLVATEGQETKIELNPEEVKKIELADVLFTKGDSNLFTMQTDCELKVMLTDMYFDEQMPPRVRMWTVGEGIADNQLYCFVYNNFNLDTWISYICRMFEK